MPAPLEHIRHDTPMGATLVADGATVRVWAPHARTVHVLGEFNDRERSDASLLTRDEHGHWRGFIAGARDRHRYMFYVVGDGNEGPKRDPYARELQTPFPSDCIIRRPDFPWHDSGFVTPRFDDLVIYQLHVGTFFMPNLPRKGGTFLDVARKAPYLAELGVTAVPGGPGGGRVAGIPSTRRAEAPLIVPIVSGKPGRRRRFRGFQSRTRCEDGSTSRCQPVSAAGAGRRRFRSS